MMKQLKYQFAYGNNLIKHLLELVDFSPKTILDFGCGESTLTNVLATCAGGGSVIGIDEDTGMVHHILTLFL